MGQSISKKEKLLEAAAEVFRSPDYDMFSDVQYQRIAKRAGFSTRTVRDAFASDAELKRELIDHMLNEETRTQTRRVETQAITDLLTDRSTPLVDALIEIGRHHLNTNLSDPMLRSQMALWPYADGTESGNERQQHIADCLLKIYQAWDTEIESAVNTFLVSHSDLCSPNQSWLTSREFGITASALVEGLSIRATLDPSHVDQELPGRALLALIATLFHIKGDADTTDSPKNIAELERRRAATA